MGIFDLLNAIISNPNQEKTLSTVDKELILVKNVKTADMVQFMDVPYNLNSPIQKFIRKGGHPFAYITLNAHNQNVAKAELEKINFILQNDKEFRRLKNKPQIPVEEIVFREYSKLYTYSKIMCSPYTFSGKLSKYPISLFFCTRMDNQKNTTHGELFYGKNGDVLKANINIWKGRSARLISLKKDGEILHVI